MNKFGAISAGYGKNLFHSKKEANFAAELDIRVRCKELKSWRRQVNVPLKVNGITVCRYVVDFVAEYPDGHEQYIEVKGFPHPVGELKMKLFKACYPQADFLVVR